MRTLLMCGRPSKVIEGLDGGCWIRRTLHDNWETGLLTAKCSRIDS